MENLRTILKKSGASVIDVRSPWEFEAEHVSGAMNIPLEEIQGRINEFKNLNGPAILYCRSGNRSGIAVNILKQAGFNDVYNGGSIFEMQQLNVN